MKDRHEYILNQLKQSGKVNVIALSQALEVSEVTIRKDLKLLEEQGLLYRNHGGATLGNPYASNRPVSEKSKVHQEEKDRIAQAAVAMIGHTDSIILGSGTTVQAMVSYLQPLSKLNVISSSLAISTALLGRDRIHIMQLGGLLRHSSGSVVGPYAESFMDHITAGMYFLGVDGIDPDYGITTTNLLEARLNQRCIEVSQVTVVLADSSKFGKRGFGRICDLSDIQHVITDKNLPDDKRLELEDLGISVTLV